MRCRPSSAWHDVSPTFRLWLLQSSCVTICRSFASLLLVFLLLHGASFACIVQLNVSTCATHRFGKFKSTFETAGTQRDFTIDPGGGANRTPIGCRIASPMDGLECLLPGSISKRHDLPEERLLRLRTIVTTLVVLHVCEQSFDDHVWKRKGRQRVGKRWCQTTQEGVA